MTAVAAPNDTTSRTSNATLWTVLVQNEGKFHGIQKLRTTEASQPPPKRHMLLFLLIRHGDADDDAGLPFLLRQMSN